MSILLAVNRDLHPYDEGILSRIMGAVSCLVLGERGEHGLERLRRGGPVMNSCELPVHEFITGPHSARRWQEPCLSLSM